MKTRMATLLTLGALPLLALAAPARAEGARRGYDRYAGSDPSAYIGFSFGQLNYKEDGLANISPNVGMFRVGATFNQNIAVEGRVGGGLFKAETNGYGVRIPNFYAAYVKGSVPLSPVFSLYGLAGVASAQIERDYPPVYDARDSGASFGAGADFNLRNGTVINAEWVRLLNGDNGPYNYSADMLTVGFAWHF